MMFVLRRDRGCMHRRMGDRHGSGKMHGRVWTGVGLDGRIDSEDGEIAKLFFLLILLC